jgi:hypothetical protein
VFALRALVYRLAGSPLAVRYRALAEVAVRGRLGPADPARAARMATATPAGEP